MRKIRKVLIFLLFSLSVFGFKLEGINFNKSLEDGYREYKIYNDSLKKARYKIQILPAGEEDVTDNLEVFPKIVTIEPKGSQMFKLFGTGKRKLENKEYQFSLRFDSIVIPTLTKNEDGKVAGNSTLTISPTVVMKGHGGKIDYSKALDLKDIYFEKTKEGKLIFNGTLVNNSHGTVELAVKLTDKGERRADSEAIGSIGANEEKKLRIELRYFKDGDDIKYIDFYDNEFVTLKRVIRE